VPEVPDGAGRPGHDRPRPAAAPPPPPSAGEAFDFGAAVSSGTEPKGRSDRPRRQDDDRPRNRRPRDEEPDDRPRRPRPRDDDEPAGGGDRPRGRRPEGGGKKFPMLLVLLGLGAVLMLCCVAPVGVYFLMLPKLQEAARKLEDEKKALDAGKNPTKAAGAGGLPTGWTKFEAPDKSVRASFPAPFPDDGGLSFQTLTTLSAKSWQSVESDGSLTCTVAVVKFRPNSKVADREKDLKTAAGLMSLGAKDLGAPRTVDWLGGQAKETEGKSGFAADVTIVTRSVVVGNTGYVAMVQHKNKADAVATFFGSVEALSK